MSLTFIAFLHGLQPAGTVSAAAWPRRGGLWHGPHRSWCDNADMGMFWPLARPSGGELKMRMGRLLAGEVSSCGAARLPACLVL